MPFGKLIWRSNAQMMVSSWYFLFLVKCSLADESPADRSPRPGIVAGRCQRSMGVVGVVVPPTARAKTNIFDKALVTAHYDAIGLRQSLVREQCSVAKETRGQWF